MYVRFRVALGIPVDSRQCKEIANLHTSLRALGIGTYVDPKPDNPYHPIATATMDTAVFDVVHMFSERGVSAVPILDETGVVINLYETVDVTVRPFLILLSIPT